MKNDVHGVRSMLRQLLQYRVPWLFRRHRTIFRTGKKFERTTTSQTCADSSSETQGQIVGTRESLNGRENMARRKVKNGEKSFFLAPIRSQNGGDRLELVWWDIVPRGSSRRSLLFFVPYKFFRPFRLSLAPFICPCVSGDGADFIFTKSKIVLSQHRCPKLTLRVHVN